MIYVKCSSPSCRAVTSVTSEQLAQGLFAVMLPTGWVFERQSFDTEANWYCKRCAEGTPDAAA